MRIVITGASGFLGWHLRTRLHALTDHDVAEVDVHNWHLLDQSVKGADTVIHLAGINRADDREVEEGNAKLASDLARAASTAATPPRIVYANSVQAGNDTPYGRGKAQAADILADAAQRSGSAFVNVLLPNLFGEYGRPNYNSFVATFVNKVVNGERPEVADRPIDLLHVQRAAQVLMDAMASDDGVARPQGTPTSVRGVLDKLVVFRDLYGNGDFPPLESPIDVDLFNTYRAALFPANYPIALQPRSDHRGRFVETVRSHGGQGQTSVSTTKPGITRGEHYHLSKVERFVVLSGNARISLRKVLTDEVVSFDVSGENPVAIDMPTMWIHNITNTGDTELVTLFWSHELFDHKAPDTYWEPVQPAEVSA